MYGRKATVSVTTLYFIVFSSMVSSDNETRRFDEFKDSRYLVELEIVGVGILDVGCMLR